MTYPNEPAFPAEWTEPDDSGQTQMLWAKGISKREYFAAMAMQGILAWQSHPAFDPKTARREKVVEDAVGVADALIAELNK